MQFFIVKTLCITTIKTYLKKKTRKKLIDCRDSPNSDLYDRKLYDKVSKIFKNFNIYVDMINHKYLKTSDILLI